MLKRMMLKVLLAFATAFQKPALYRRWVGVKIGPRARFTGTINFGSEPFLIEIGSHVTLAHNVTFHTHDGGVWVLRDKHPDINVYGSIKIGDNVFVGSNVIILPNVTIGNNVVVGAGSVVTRSIPDDCVVAGNPARIIRTTRAYEENVLLKAVIVDSSNIEKASPAIVNAARSRL